MNLNLSSRSSTPTVPHVRSEYTGGSTGHTNNNNNNSINNSTHFSSSAPRHALPTLFSNKNSVNNETADGDDAVFVRILSSILRQPSMSRRQQTLLSLWAASGRINTLFDSNRFNTTVLDDDKSTLRNNGHHDYVNQAIRAVEKFMNSSRTHTPALCSSYHQTHVKTTACTRDITNVDTDIEDCDEEEDDNIAKSSVHVASILSPFPALEEKGSSSNGWGNKSDEEKKELRVFKALLDEMQHPPATAMNQSSSTMKFTTEILTIGQALCELCAKVLSSLTQLIKALNERHLRQGSSSSAQGLMSSSPPPLPPAPAILRMEPFLDHFFALSAHLLRANVAVPNKEKAKRSSSSVKTIASHLADTHPKLISETRRFFREEFVRLVSLNHQRAGWGSTCEDSSNNNQDNNENRDSVNHSSPSELAASSYTLAIDKDSNFTGGRSPLIFTISILSALFNRIHPTTRSNKSENNEKLTKVVSSRDRNKENVIKSSDEDIFGGPKSLAKTIELLVRFLVTPPPPSCRGTTRTNDSVDGQSERHQHHPTELSLKRVEVSEHYATASMAAIKALRELFVLKQATTTSKREEENHHHNQKSNTCTTDDLIGRSATLFQSIESCSWIHLPPFSTLPCEEATNAASATTRAHNARFVSTSQAFSSFLTQRAPTPPPPQLGKEIQNGNTTTSSESSPSATLLVSCGSNSADEFFINVVVRHMLYGTLLPSLANTIRNRLEKDASGELSQQLSGRYSAISSLLLGNSNKKPFEASSKSQKNAAEAVPPSESSYSNSDDDLVQSLFQEECANAVEVNSVLWVLEACCWVVEDGVGGMHHGEGSGGGGGFLADVLLSVSSSSKPHTEIPQISTTASLFSKRVVPSLAFLMDVTRGYLLHIADVDASTIAALTVVPSFTSRIISSACRPVADLLGALGKIDVQRTAQKFLAEVSSSAGGNGGDSESIVSIISRVESTRKRILQAVYEQTLDPPQNAFSTAFSPNTSLAWEKVGTIISGILGMARDGYVADSVRLTNALVFSDHMSINDTARNSSSDDCSLRHTAPLVPPAYSGGFGGLGGRGELLLLAAEDPATGCSYASRGDVTTAVLVSSLMKATFARKSACSSVSEHNWISSGEFTPTFWPTSLWGGMTKNNFSQLSSSTAESEKQPNLWRDRQQRGARSDRIQQTTATAMTDHHQHKQGLEMACAVQYTFSCGFALVSELLRKYFQFAVSDPSVSRGSSFSTVVAPSHGGRCPSSSASHSASTPSIHETLYYEDGGTSRGDSYSNPTPQSTKGHTNTSTSTPDEEFSVYANRIFSYISPPFPFSTLMSQREALTGAHQLLCVGELHLLEGRASLYSSASIYHPSEEQSLTTRRHQIHSEIFTAVDPSLSSLTNSFLVCHWLRASLVNVAASVSSSTSPSARCSELLFQYVCDPSITARLSLPKRVLEGVLAWQSVQKKVTDRNQQVQEKGEAQVPVAHGDDGMLLCRSSTEIEGADTNNNLTGRNSGAFQQEIRGATPTSATIMLEQQRKRNSFELPPPPPSRRMSLNLGSLVPRPSEKFDLGGEIADAFICNPNKHQSCMGISSSSSSVSSSLAIRSVPADQMMMSNILAMSQNTTRQLLLNKEVYSQRKTEELKIQQQQQQQQPRESLQSQKDITGAGYEHGGFYRSQLHVDPTLVENTMNNNNNFDTYCERELSGEHGNNDGERESEREFGNDVAETQQWAAVNDDFYDERRAAAGLISNPYHTSTFPSHRDGYGQEEGDDLDNASAVPSLSAVGRIDFHSTANSIKKKTSVIREDDDDDILVFASPLRRQKKGSGGAARGGEGTGEEDKAKKGEAGGGGGGRALLVGGVCVAAATTATSGGDDDGFTCNSNPNFTPPQGFHPQNNNKNNSTTSNSNNSNYHKGDNMNTANNHHPSSHLFLQQGGVTRLSTPSPSDRGGGGTSTVNTTLVVNNMSRENSNGACIGTLASSSFSSTTGGGGGSSAAHQKGGGEQPKTAAASLSGIPITPTSSSFSTAYSGHHHDNTIQSYASSSSPFISISIVGLEQLISGMKAHAADYDHLQSSLAEAQATAKRLAEENNQLRRKFQREVQNLKQDNVALQDQLEASKKESLQASAHFANEMMVAMKRLEDRNKRVAELESQNNSLANRVKRQEAKTMQMLSMLNSE